MTTSIRVADYLYLRLKQAGVDHLFGVPGDYNLWLLEALLQQDQIEWTSNANELNAAYAADGYARTKGLAALITTFGVGELSALNGIAGSAAEHVPVLHIVGAPPLAAQASKSPMHHTFGDGDFERFLRIHAEVAVGCSMLTPETAVSEIDRVLNLVIEQNKPGYLVIPMDVVNHQVEVPAQATARTVQPSPTALADLRHALAACLAEPKRVSLIAGHLAERFGVKQGVRSLVQAHALMSASLLMGKGTLDERADSHIGLYVGGASEPAVKQAIEGCDLVIAVGVTFTDAVTGGFTDGLDHMKVLDIQPFSTHLHGVAYPLRMHEAIQCLDDVLKDHRPLPTPLSARAPAASFDPDATLNQADLWTIVGQSLTDNDIIVADLGTTFFGAASITLPQGAGFVAQPLWGSIGFSIPAAYGAKKAAPGSHVLLIVGDGSALLTAQEIGSMLRDDLSLTVLLLNNEGYTIERLICNPQRAYHDVPAWDWTRLPGLMGKGKAHETHTVTRNRQLVDALVGRGEQMGLRFIEAMLPKLDAPVLMTTITDAITKKQSQ
ncbi:TPA: alpha-keto acid decarboxylase family protein [Pseudomonas putida]|nr:alpha-keto acid decarboxylase family protein [Pseudomonas putida]